MQLIEKEKKTTDKPLISVIIPVYNAEECLEICLRGILKQTFVNFEIILIDDGSTDSSLDICNKFALQNQKISVFHQSNVGVSKARNKGLDEARGKYIVFVDADDKVLPNYLELFIYDKEIPEGTLVLQGHLIEKNGVIQNLNLSKTEYYYKNLHENPLSESFLLFGPPWSKLFEMKLIKRHNLRFEGVVSSNEDGIFHLKYLMHIKAVKKVSECGYIYVKRDTKTITTRLYSFEELLTGLNIMLPLIKNVIKKYKVKEKAYLNGLYVIPLLRLELAVTSLYRNKYRKNRKNRLSSLALLLDENFALIKEYYVANCTKKKVLKNIFLLKSMFLVDILMLNIVKIKYNS